MKRMTIEIEETDFMVNVLKINNALPFRSGEYLPTEYISKNFAAFGVNHLTKSCIRLIAHHDSEYTFFGIKSCETIAEEGRFYSKDFFYEKALPYLKAGGKELSRILKKPKKPKKKVIEI